MLSVLATFWKVARIPDAAPRCSAGTEFMMAVVLGAANVPIPTPKRMRSRTKASRLKLAGSCIIPTKATAVMSIPAVAKPRAP